MKLHRSDYLQIHDEHGSHVQRKSKVRLTKTARVWLGIGLSVILLVGIILFSVAWSVVEPLEYAFNYNGATGSVDLTRIYEPGRYFIGVGHYFVTFPTTQVNVVFTSDPNADSPPIATRTSNGVSLTISFSLQYRLIKENLVSVYNNYGITYTQPMIRAVRSVVHDIAGQQGSPFYWLSRQQVTAAMFAAVSNELYSNYYMNCTGFQILLIQFPDSYEDSIINSQVQQQKVKQQQYQQNVTAIESSISQLLAVAGQNITKINAAANATAISIVNLAQAQIFNFTQSSLAAGYQAFATRLNMTSAELLNYMKIRILRRKTDSPITLGMASPNTT